MLSVCLCRRTMRAAAVKISFQKASLPTVLTMRQTIMRTEMRRGDVYYADLRPVIGSEQGGIRPVLIIQNDVGNKHSPTVICAAITSKMNKAKLPTHIELNARLYDMDKDSVVLLEQLRTIDKKRLKDKVCHLDGDIMRRVNRALKVSLELDT